MNVIMTVSERVRVTVKENSTFDKEEEAWYMDKSTAPHAHYSSRCAELLKPMQRTLPFNFG